MPTNDVFPKKDRAAVLLDFLYDNFDSPKDAIATLEEVRTLLTQAVETVSQELLEQALQDMLNASGDRS
jgi:hypothetical protein